MRSRSKWFLDHPARPARPKNNVLVVVVRVRRRHFDVFFTTMMRDYIYDNKTENAEKRDTNRKKSYSASYSRVTLLPALSSSSKSRNSSRLFLAYL